MSRPISIGNTCTFDPSASPIESLGRSIGAQKIVDSVCGSPIVSLVYCNIEIIFYFE